MTHAHTLHVEFRGLAIHFNRGENPELDLPCAHRVVVPHRDTPLHWEGIEIPVHEPSLRLGDDVMPLHGVTLRVHGGGGESGVRRNFRCLPRLRRVWQYMVLDRSAVTGRNAAIAAAYFDIERGLLEGFDHHGSAAARLRIDFNAPAATLAIEGWNGESRTIDIALPATIVIENTAKASGSDGVLDFVLDFLVASNFPPHSLPNLGTALGEVLRCLNHRPEPPDLGPGCSNSQYP